MTTFTEDYCESVNSVIQVAGGRIEHVRQCDPMWVPPSFPVGIGRIQWEQHPQSLWGGWDQPDCKGIQNVPAFIDEVAVGRFSISLNAPVVLEGDNMDARIREITLRTVRDQSGVLFEWPQHYYVTAESKR